MTDTEKITNEVYDRHALYAPADDDERQAQHFGQPYIDVDGNWHTGRHYTDQNDVPASLRMNSRWPAWKRNLLVGCVVGGIMGAPLGLWLWHVSLAFRTVIYWIGSLLG